MATIHRSCDRRWHRRVAVLCAILIAPGNRIVDLAPTAQAAQASTTPDAAPIPADQLDSLVAPIALYPDPLLAQTLAASTYPLELMQLQQWLARNPGLKDKALTDAVAKEPWDPSVQAMAALPDVVKRLADDIQWTTELGNAFLAQQGDVMDAVQRMRHKAEGTGNLKSSSQQKVETQVVENKQVIVIEQSDPEVVYVPSYNPTVVYGAPIYPYPPIYYPPPGAYAAGMAISWGVGVAMGAAWGGGGWGWNAGWGDNDITINNNNNFSRNANINGGNRVNNGRGNWQHNPQHRGGTPYRDRNTANRFGGTTRGDSLANRQAGARQQLDRQGGNLRSEVGTSGVRDRAAGGGIGDRGNRGDVGNRAGVGNLGDRGAAGNLGDRAGSRDIGSRPNSGNFGDRSAGREFGNRTGGDRIGSRDIQRGGGDRGAFGGGGGGGFSGSRERMNSSRGASSIGSRPSGGFGGGGHSRGGGGSRGGSRGGGRRGR